MFDADELAEERQRILDWYNTTCTPEFQRTILSLVTERLKELGEVALDPQLHKRKEFEGMSYERARGNIEGEAGVLLRMSKWRPEAQAALDELKQQDELEQQRNAQMPGPGAVRESGDTSWAERRAGM
jgi:hypothetical protein